MVKVDKTMDKTADKKVTCPSCWQKVPVTRVGSCAICSAHLCTGCWRRHSVKSCNYLRLLLEPCVPRPVEAWANA